MTALLALASLAFDVAGSTGIERVSPGAGAPSRSGVSGPGSQRCPAGPGTVDIMPEALNENRSATSQTEDRDRHDGGEDTS